MYSPICEPLVSSCIDCKWLARRLVTLDSYGNRKCRWWDVWAEPTVLPLFEGLPDVNTTYFMFMVVVLTDVLRWAPLIPLLMLECYPVGLTYLETNPIICIDLRYGMRCWNVDDDRNQWLLVRTPPDGPDVSNPFVYSPILFWMYRELIGSTSDCKWDWLIVE